MSGMTLIRRDPARNLHRYYRLDVQLDLFGAWCLIREWGRVGQGGQMRSTPYPTVDEAQEALERQRRRKERRGYQLLSIRPVIRVQDLFNRKRTGFREGGQR